MPPPSEWGPLTWNMIHALAANVKPQFFPQIYGPLIQLIISICSHLPCPDCTRDAMSFWAKHVNIQNIKTKDDLNQVLFVFHNHVNRRTNRPIANPSILEKYKTMNIINVFVHFASKFHTDGNMKLISDAFHRRRFIVNMRKWILTHLNFFSVYYDSNVVV